MKSMLSKLWLGISTLVLVILLVIWVFQIVFLEKFYISERTDLLIEEGHKITSLILESKSKNSDLISSNVMDEINSFQSSYNIRIVIVNSKDEELYNSFDIPYFKKGIPSNESKETFLHSEDMDIYIMHQDRNQTKRSSIVVKIPIKDGEKIIGSVTLLSAVAPIKETTTILTKQLSIITFISLIIGTVLALLLAKIFTRPLLKIIATAKEIAKGDFKVQVSIDSKDEIGVLGDTINDLAVQLEQIEKFRKEFIANTSHELKTPLSLIRAYAELVMDIDEDHENKKQYLEIIIDETCRLNNMVEDILCLSEMESGYYKPKLQHFPVIETIKGILKKISLLAEKNNIHLILEYGDKNLLVYGDEKKMEQVFYNIINNAITHSYEKGSVLIKINAIDGVIRIEVKDNGSGIPEEDLPYVWDRFYKVDKSRKRNTSGTGLGMPIVKNILESHHCQYGIISKAGKGTVVWFELQGLEG